MKEGHVISIINPPDDYFIRLIELPENVTVENNKKIKKDIIHYFVLKAVQLIRDLPALKNEITTSGMIWISWPKKSSKVPTDITEDFIRKRALISGLVDIKVCAVDEVWSGLKLVIPLKQRK